MPKKKLFNNFYELSEYQPVKFLLGIRKIINCSNAPTIIFPSNLYYNLDHTFLTTRPLSASRQFSIPNLFRLFALQVSPLLLPPTNDNC